MSTAHRVPTASSVPAADPRRRLLPSLRRSCAAAPAAPLPGSAPPPCKPPRRKQRLAPLQAPLRICAAIPASPQRKHRPAPLHAPSLSAFPPSLAFYSLNATVCVATGSNECIMVYYWLLNCMFCYIDAAHNFFL